MGGLGSGLRTDRPTVGECLSIAVSETLSLREGRTRWAGEWTWKDGYGRPCGRVAFRCVLDGETGLLTLFWRIRDAAPGEPALHRQEVVLTSTAQPLGGRRWWFVCPHWGGRVLRLHRPPGGGGFAGRKALGLAYRSQRRSVAGRCLDRALATRKALGGDPNRGVVAPFPLKPKWMHWRRYERMRRRTEIDEAHRTRLLLPEFERFAKRAGLDLGGA